jgi:hypothetical protein
MGAGSGSAVLPPPPVDLGERGGGDSGWVVLTRATDDIDAHLLAGRLDQAGIETNTIKDRGSPGAWLYGGSNPWAPVTILVRKFQLDDAKIVLAEISLAGPDAEPIDESTRSRWRFPLAWWAAAIALGLLFTLIGVSRTARSADTCLRQGVCTQDVP